MIHYITNWYYDKNPERNLEQQRAMEFMQTDPLCQSRWFTSVLTCALWRPGDAEVMGGTTGPALILKPSHVTPASPAGVGAPGRTDGRK